MSVEIPENVVQFLDRATVGIGGTRDAKLMPHVHRLSGWIVRPDRKAITCLVAPPFATDLLSSLESNGEFALTVSEVPSHETYQFKGRSLGSREVGVTDLAVCERQRERFTASIGPLFGFSDDALRAYISDPSIAFDFSVRDIFIQTPGPDAGARLAGETE